MRDCKQLQEIREYILGANLTIQTGFRLRTKTVYVLNPLLLLYLQINIQRKLGTCVDKNLNKL